MKTSPLYSLLKPAKYMMLFFLLSYSTKDTSSQSDITYDAGTSIIIDAGADICADAVRINGVLSGLGTICNGPNPVMISMFTAATENNNVILTWRTDWETNNKGFEVERCLKSQLPVGWCSAGFVEGSGTSANPHLYRLRDNALTAGEYFYRLKQIDFNGNFELFNLEAPVKIKAPKTFEVSQNYPNPSNPKSRIKFELPASGLVTIEVFDMLGRVVITLVNEKREAGYYSADFDGSSLSSGVYFYRLTLKTDSKTYQKTMKMILVK